MSFYAVYTGGAGSGGAGIVYDTGAGATTSNTLRTVIVTDQTSIPVVTTPAVAGPTDFGASATAARVAALIGNTTGIADFNTGAAGAQTLRTVISSRSEAAATPLATRSSDGTNFSTSVALTAAQATVSTATSIPMNQGIQMGWDGTIHRESLFDSTGANVLAYGSMPTQTNSGTMAALNATVQVGATLGYSMVSCNITGSWVGTITFQTSIDNSTWVTANAFGITTAGSNATTTSANTQVIIPAYGMQYVRVQMTAYTSGTATVAFVAGKLTNYVKAQASLIQGTGLVAVTNPIFVQPTNGATVWTTTAITAAQTTASTAAVVPNALVFNLGWDGTTHRELSCDTSGKLNINAAITGSSALSYTNSASIAGTALTTTYATVLTTSGTVTTKSLQIFNSCNQTVVVSLNGGTSNSYILEVGDQVSLDLTANGINLAVSTAIQAKANSTIPTAGTVRVSAVG